MKYTVSFFVSFLAACNGSSGGSAPGGASRATSRGEPEKIRVIATGSAFAKSDYIIPGYVTILDFYADW